MTDPLLEVSTQTRDGSTVLAFSGEIDMSTVPILRAAVDKALGDGAAVVTIDATEITFADSSAVQALLNARDAATESGARFQLAHVVGQMAQTLSVTGTDQVFEILGP